MIVFITAGQLLELLQMISTMTDEEFDEFVRQCKKIIQEGANTNGVQ